MIDRHLLVELVADCDKRVPEEACGFVVNGRVIPCENAHSNPEENFAISAEDYAKAEAQGEIQCVYHSHTNGMERFSPHDIKACKQSGLPWLVYSTTTKNWWYGDPSGNTPYIGRDWLYGIYDCYSLLRDFYRRELNIQLDDFDRGLEGEWNVGGWRMFERNYAGQGFVEVGDAERKGDMILMQIGAPSPNHVGVFAGQGCSFYHQLVGRKSQLTTFGNYWRQRTVKVLRHRSLM